MSHDLILALVLLVGIAVGVGLVQLIRRSERPAAPADPKPEPVAAPLAQPPLIRRTRPAISITEKPEAQEEKLETFDCARCGETYPDWFGEALAAGIFASGSLRDGGIFGEPAHQDLQERDICRVCLGDVTRGVPTPGPNESEEIWQARLATLLGKRVLPHSVEADWHKREAGELSGSSGSWNNFPGMHIDPSANLDRKLTIAEAAAGIGALDRGAYDWIKPIVRKEEAGTWAPGKGDPLLWEASPPPELNFDTEDPSKIFIANVRRMYAENVPVGELAALIRKQISDFGLDEAGVRRLTGELLVPEDLALGFDFPKAELKYLTDAMKLVSAPEKESGQGIFG